MKNGPSLYETLTLALEALNASKPTHNHYAEPVARHAKAIIEVQDALRRLDRIAGRASVAAKVAQ